MDPPYEGVSLAYYTQFEGDFWWWVDNLRQNVYVSEYSNPLGFDCVESALPVGLYTVKRTTIELLMYRKGVR